MIFAHRVAGLALVMAALTPAIAFADGKSLFLDNCSACHQPTGKGVPGAFPALAGSAFVQGDPKIVMTTVLNGRAGMPSFKDDLVRRGIPGEKIVVVVNGVDLWLYGPPDPDPALAAEWALDGMFVVGYVGTHGMAHGLVNIVDAAERLRGETGLRFLLAGDGAESRRCGGGPERSAPSGGTVGEQDEGDEVEGVVLGQRASTLGRHRHTDGVGDTRQGVVLPCRDEDRAAQRRGLAVALHVGLVALTALADIERPASLDLFLGIRALLGQRGGRAQPRQQSGGQGDLDPCPHNDERGL